MNRFSLHVQIIVSLLLGVCFAALSIQLGLPASFAVGYIKPLGTVFINSLKMVAIPLVFVSLVISITSIKDTSKLSRMGSKTILLYLATTIMAVVLGLVMANVVQPGKVLSEHTRERLLRLHEEKAMDYTTAIDIHATQEPLQFIVNLVPENVIASMGDNTNLIQVVFIAILLGTALLRIPTSKSQPVLLFFEGINEALVAIIRLIMQLAPIGVFALVSALLIEIVDNSNANEMLELLYALLWYIGTTLSGFAFMNFIIYPGLLRIFTKMSYARFFHGIYPAQLVAFTTSSSAAALPITMERTEKYLGVSEEVSSFVLPLGATVNMDGTAFYQGMAILFIAQALGLELSWGAQLGIVANVVVSSVGVASVPGGAMVTTTMLLQTLGIPAAGIALILAPDRIIDMFRTAINITGDATVAVIIASREGTLK